jgi:hypothetical protein
MVPYLPCSAAESGLIVECVCLDFMGVISMRSSQETLAYCHGWGMSESVAVVLLFCEAKVTGL